MDHANFMSFRLPEIELNKVVINNNFQQTSGLSCPPDIFKINSQKRFLVQAICNKS